MIFEKSGRLGGQLNIADKAVLKEKLAAYKESLIYRVENAGIEVRYHTEATVDMVKELNPAGVFVATGGNAIVPPLPGIDQDHVMTAEDVLTGTKNAEGKVAVIGGGITGIETAETLAEKGHEVMIIEMAKSVGNGLYASVLADHMMRLNKRGAVVMTNQKLMGIQGNKLQLLDMNAVKTSLVEADTIVLALGTKPDSKAVEEFENAFENVVVLGDANKPGRIVEAAYDGFSRATIF